MTSHGPLEINKPESRMVYCWVIDGPDTLNNWLIKNGCFPGGTMMRPKTWKEMPKEEREMYQESGQKPDIKVLVQEDVYLRFLDQIRSAEISAREKKLGIWAVKQEE